MTPGQIKYYLSNKSVRQHKYSDNKKNLYVDKIHISSKWFIDKIERQNNKCFWCNKTFEYNIEPRCPNMPTVDRIFNEIGHWTPNCVIACDDCNTFDGMKKIFIRKAIQDGKDLEEVIVSFHKWINTVL
jgi:hypothetical protein